MVERGTTADRPLARISMVNNFEEDRELFERRQRRNRLADDLLEDSIDEADVDLEGDDMADDPPEPALTGVVEIADDESGGAVPRMSTRSPIEMEEWGEAPDKLEEVEPEIGDLELEEGIDDPVRMYLREIGKVSLLTADDEKKLARAMEDSDYILRIESAHFEQTGRNARGVDVLAGLLRDLRELQKPIDALTKELGVEKLPLDELIVSEQFRRVVDGELDIELVQRFAASLKIEEADAEKMQVRISVVTHVITPEMVAAATKEMGSGGKIAEPPEDLGDRLLPSEDRFKAHFNRIREEGF